MTVSDSLIGYDTSDGTVDLADTEGHDGADDVEEPASAPGGQSSKGRKGRRLAPRSRRSWTPATPWKPPTSANGGHWPGCSAPPMRACAS